MRLYIRDDVHMATVGDDVVCLDLQDGSYSCLPGMGGAVGPIGVDGGVDIPMPEIVELLEASGLLAEAPPAAVRPLAPNLPMPSASAWRTGEAMPTSADRRRMARACASMVGRYWGRSFVHLVRHAASGRAGARLGTVDPDVVRDARLFDQMMPAVPFQGECLFRSAMLLAFLRLAGRDARWVIGVQTHPFLAHCWLQVGDTVLDDAAERVCGFIPILTI